MKLKPTYLIAFCLLITACACDSDDDSIKTVELTETNYFYESDAYVYALNVERQDLIDYLENPDSPDYNEEQAQQSEERIQEIDSIIETTTTGIIIQFPPIPPPPPICICWDVWNEFKLGVVDDEIVAFEMTITNENQEVIFETNTLAEQFNINGYDVEAKAYSFQILQEGYSGPATLNVNKVLNAEDDPISYSVPIFIEEF